MCCVCIFNHVLVVVEVFNVHLVDSLFKFEIYLQTYIPSF